MGLTPHRTKRTLEADAPVSPPDDSGASAMQESEPPDADLNTGAAGFSSGCWTVLASSAKAAPGPLGTRVLGVRGERPVSFLPSHEHRQT